MGISLSVDRPASRQVVCRILEGIAGCVAAQTTFRRVLVSAYETPLVPGAAESTSIVAGFACREICAEQERELSEFVERGGHVSGELYVQSARVGHSYFFPSGAEAPPSSVRLPSSRSFINHGGWQAQDILLTPFWNGTRVIGQIAVDDPVDGSRPSLSTLSRLEELAEVGGVALRDALELEDLAEAHRVFRLLTESTMTGILLIEENEAQYVNGSACELLGYSKEELLSLSPWWQVVHPDDRPTVWQENGGGPEVKGTVRAIRRDGRIIWLTTSIYPMEHRQGGSAFVLHFFDITEHVETESQLKEKALRDPLTGLLNRSYFEDAIQTEMERSKRYKRPLTLMMADLTRFKAVNDQLGHQEGDRILSGVSSVIRSQLRDSDWVVRYGGDEFLFVLPETGEGVETLEERLREAVDDWCADNVKGVPVSIDLGWATWTADRPRDVAELVREADQMLYKRKAER